MAFYFVCWSLAYHDDIGSQSNLRVLLRGYMEAGVPALRHEIGLLLRHVLASDPLFQHDPDEIYLWLECIPSDPARCGTKSPDGVELLDGGPIVVQFLDECFLRCAQAPYKYIEDLSTVTTSPSISKEPSEDSIIKRPELFPSPVLITLLEQLSVLVDQNPSPSDLYSLSVFFRRLIFRLAQKTQSLSFIRAITEKVDAIFGDDILPGYPRIVKAVRREVRILRACLTGLEGPALGTQWSITDQMQAFLATLEGTPLGTLFNNSCLTFEAESQGRFFRRNAQGGRYGTRGLGSTCRPLFAPV
jgi:nucleolar pre-ribosomal-associated protein 1